jgi:putative ABC transport system permease protein
MSVLERIYGAVLRVLPSEFREAHGRAMEESFAAGLREARERSGLPGGIAWAVRDMLDVAMTGVRLRRSGRGWNLGKQPVRRSGGAMGMLAEDVRHGFRLWAKTPAFTALAALTLAIGIGCTAAIFTVVDDVVLRPLPHRGGDRLVNLFETNEGMEGRRLPVSYPNFRDWRDAGEATGLEDMGAYSGLRTATVVVNGEPEALSVQPISGNLLELLGNAPQLGRGIGPDDDSPTADRVVLVSHGVWQSRFGGDSGLPGRSLRIDGNEHTVLGVMPPDFIFPRAGVDLWVALRLDEAQVERDLRFLNVISRLPADRGLAEAQARMDDVMARLVAEWPDENAGGGVLLQSRKELVLGEIRPVLYVLFGAVALLLLLTCANLANLLLARATTRGREIAVRSALGAGRRRILAQLLAEYGVLAVIGGGFGLLFGWAGTAALVSLAPASLPRRAEIALDLRVVAFTAGVTILSALFFGILPALRASHGEPGDALRDRGMRGVGSAGRHPMLAALVVTQLAIAMVLLIGSGLLLNSFVRLLGVDPGFQPDRVLTLRVAPPTQRYPEFADLEIFYETLLGRARALPGVEEAGATWAVPFTTDWASGRVTAEGRPMPPGDEIVIGTMPVRGNYFEALRIPLIAGRLFGPQDDAQTDVVLLNQAAARLLFPGDENVIGNRLKRGRAAEDVPWLTVIGVVGDARRFGLDAGAEPEMYRTHASQQWARDMRITLRSAGDPLALAQPLRAIIRDLDPGLAVTEIAVLRDLVGQSLDEERFRTILLAAFAGVALLLSLIGIYGVLAFVVARRTGEIGLRMALGAERGRVLTEVLRSGARLIALGLLIGLAVAAFASRSLESMLFGLQALDATTYIAVAVTLSIAAFLACWIPAARAARVEPLTALRRPD